MLDFLLTLDKTSTTLTKFVSSSDKFCSIVDSGLEKLATLVNSYYDKNKSCMLPNNFNPRL